MSSDRLVNADQTIRKGTCKFKWISDSPNEL